MQEFLVGVVDPVFIDGIFRNVVYTGRESPYIGAMRR